MRKKSGFFRDFFGTVRQDLRDVNLKTSLGRDLNSIYEFYLTSQERKELQAMGWLRRWISRVFWFLKNILYKLTPFRRLLLLLSFILLFEIQTASRVLLAFIILFLILVLELKDKLLAHDELKAGRAVQAALRPQKCPDIHGWEAYLYTRSANDVGGDLIDCIEQENDVFGFMVGDVAGKGLGAALLMAQLQASVHALVSYIKSLPKLVAQLNKLYCKGGLSNTFISFLYLQVRSNSGKVSFVNAGHLPPIIQKSEKMIEWHKGSLALGLSPTSKYKEEILDVDVGDLLLVYTDGITEARNSDGLFFGEQRMYDALSRAQQLSAEKAALYVIKKVDQFVGNASRSDDLTLLVLKRTS